MQLELRVNKEKILFSQAIKMSTTLPQTKWQLQPSEYPSFLSIFSIFPLVFCAPPK